MMAGCARHDRDLRVMCVNLGEKVSAPSPSSLIGVFKFTQTNMAAVPRDDVLGHSPDHGAVYLNVYRRFRQAVASRRPAPTYPMVDRGSRCRMRLDSVADHARSGTRVTCPCVIG